MSISSFAAPIMTVCLLVFFFVMLGLIFLRKMQELGFFKKKPEKKQHQPVNADVIDISFLCRLQSSIAR